MSLRHPVPKRVERLGLLLVCVLQCVAVCCSVLQCGAVVLHCVAVCCSVLMYIVAVCCSAL